MSKFKVLMARTSIASTTERSITYPKYGPRDRITIFIIATASKYSEPNHSKTISRDHKKV